MYEHLQLTVEIINFKGIKFKKYLQEGVYVFLELQLYHWLSHSTHEVAIYPFHIDKTKMG